MRRQPESFATAVRAFKEMTAATDDAAATRARVLAEADRGARVHRTPRRIAVTTVIALLVICSASVAGTTLAQRWRRPAAVAIEETLVRAPQSDRRLTRDAARRSSFRPSSRRSTTRPRPDRRTPRPTPTGAPTAPTSTKALPSARSPPGTTTCGSTHGAPSSPRHVSTARSASCACGALRKPSARSGHSPTDASATTAAPKRSSSWPGCATAAAPRRKRQAAKLDRTSRKCRSVVCRRPWMLFSAWRRRLFFFGGRTSSSESSGWVTSTSSTW